MRAVSLQIHNFRSIHHLDLSLSNLSLLAGANNSGKSTILEAIRMFYGNTKWDTHRDEPKIPSSDNESWVEIEFLPSTLEGAALKEEYRSETGSFRVRNYIRSSNGTDGKPRSGYYAYENGKLSENQFYGDKNVGSGKIGHLVFIPAVSKIDENMKLTGPSVLRDLIAEVINKAISGSPAYQNLSTAFDEFESSIKAQQNGGGQSLEELEREVSEEISVWDANFSIAISSLQPEEMLKTLVRPLLVDEITGSEIDQANFGAGFQRHLIYTLIKLAAQHANPHKVDNMEKKQFSPNLTWILFEEPEAFLHPSQEEIMHESLLEISDEDNTQVLLTTHSAQFVSRSMDELTRLIRVRRDSGILKAYQLKEHELNELFDASFELDQTIKSSGRDPEKLDKAAIMAAFKTELWMQTSRAGSFFSDRVVLVEGASEVAFYRYLTSRRLMERPRAGLSIVDCLGKWNIHRIVALFGAFGIEHSVIYDGDSKEVASDEITSAIEKARNPFTKRVTRWEKDIENALGITATPDKYAKPQNILYFLEAGLVDEKKLASTIQEFVQLANSDT